MPTKKESITKSVPKDDDLMPQVLGQLDILNKAIQMINNDIEKMHDRLEKLASRMGL
tara:strand:+ start:510 stop:680 length:171 start_codon:yes stop_codon:yes gene_type:complete